MKGGLRSRLDLGRLGDYRRLLVLSARLVAGRRFWIAPLLPLAWIVYAVFQVLVGWRLETYTSVDAQNLLVGFPLTVLALGLGVRIIAGEIDRRTLEIAYTVPGGAHRVWLAKLGAALILLVAAEALLALAVYLFCTAFPVGALYGALQAAAFYLVLAMALSALFRSEAAGALVAVAVLVVNFFLQPAGTRLSPFWNPLRFADANPAELLAWTVENRIGFVLAAAALAVLAFARAENRERLLGS